MSGQGRPMRARGRRRPGPVRWVLAGLLVLPVVEIAVAVAVAHRIGPGWTLVALAACSVVGLVVLRRAGRAALASLGPQVVPPGTARAAGPVSRARGADLALELAGAVLLTLPGFVTSALGALLVLPPTRHAVRPLLGAVAVRLLAATMRRRSGRVIAGETVDVRAVEPPAE